MLTVPRLALAGALAAATLVPTLTTADAGGPYKHWYNHHHNHGWNPGSAIVAGTVLGLTIGALSSPYYYDPYPPPVYYAPYPPPYPAAAADAHFEWCSATYRSYNGESDTWVDANGVVRPCVGPY